MPVYVYKCEKCGNIDDDIRTIAKRDEPMNCSQIEGATGPCPGMMQRCYQEELVHSTDREYAKPVLSEALGVDPSQVAEHRRLHPDVPILDDGRVVLKSHSERNRIMKRLGFHDRDGYN